MRWLFTSTRLFRWQQRAILLVSLALAGFLFSIQQPLAALLAPIIGLLLVLVVQRDARAREIAAIVSTGESPEKLEVPAGTWGELYRAINRLLQERRTQQRLSQALPLTLPDHAVRELLENRPLVGHSQRVVTVLLISSALPTTEPNRSLLDTWRLCADIAREQARQAAALVQPTSNGVLLVFGAFADESPETSLRHALQAVQQIEQRWQTPSTSDQPLSLSLTSGTVTVALLPGLGFCALGTAIEQVMLIDRTGAPQRGFRMLCDETVYFTLRRMSNQNWQPTGNQTTPRDGRPQAVYGLAA